MGLPFQIFAAVRQNRGNYTLPGRILCDVLDLTQLKQPQLGPSEVETMQSRSPAWRKLMWGKLKVKEAQHSGSDKKSSVLETRTVKTNLAESSRGSVSDSRRPQANVGPRLWLEGHMDCKILIPLQSFISYFLEPPVNRQAAVGAAEGLWQGLLPSVSWRLCRLLCLSSCCPSGWRSSVLNLLCAKDQASETVGTGEAFSSFSDKLWKGFLSMFFPLLFPPILQLLSLSMPLLTKHWAGHHLSVSESCI